MLATDRPQLRPYLAASPEDQHGRKFIVHDRLRLNGAFLRLNALELNWLKLFNGQLTLREIQAEAIRQVDGQLLPLEYFTSLASGAGGSPVPRRAAFSGTRSTTPFVGRPASAPTRANPTLFVAKSKDCSRGRADQACREQRGRTTTCGRCWRRTSTMLAAASPTPGDSRNWPNARRRRCSSSSAPRIYSSHRFTLTRKHFQTPLGVAPTDQAYIDRLVQHYGDGLFDDEWMAHLPEHSIELEVVFLQYLYEGRRPIRIVPLVVGSFQDAVEDGSRRTKQGDMAGMIEALRAARRETREPICYIISGDLAHIGPKFGDRRPGRRSIAGTTAGSRTRHFCARPRRPTRPAISTSSPRKTTAAASAACRRRIRCCEALQARGAASCCTTISTSIRAATRASASPAWRFIGDVFLAKPTEPAPTPPPTVASRRWP